MTFRQQPPRSPLTSHISRASLLSLVVLGLAACVVAPVEPAARPPTLQAVEGTTTIKVGDEKDLLPLIRDKASGMVPVGELTWSVSNPALLHVEPGTGRVKGLGKGDVIVTVSRGGSQSDATQLIVSILGEAAATVREVRVTPAKQFLVVGATVPLRAAVVMPDGQVNANVTWSSSDDTVATINPTTGEARALRVGQVTIVAAYTVDTRFKGLAELTIVASAADVPASPPPESTLTPATAPAATSAAATPIVTKTTAPSTPLPSAALTAPPVQTSAPTARPTPTPAPTLAPGMVGTLAGADLGFADGQGAAAQFSYPHGLALGADGNLYVADGSCRIRRITPAGIVSSLAGSTPGFYDGAGTGAKFSWPQGLVFGPGGDLFVTELMNNRVRRVTLKGEVTTVAGSMQGMADGRGVSARFALPRGVAYGRDGNLYVADSANGCIRKVTPGGDVTTFAGAGSGHEDGAAGKARFNLPNGIVAAPDGMFYVVDSYNHRIRKITPEGDVTTLAGSSAGYADGQGNAAKFDRPEGIAMGQDGALYVADTFNNRIRKVTLAGEVSTVAGSEYGIADGPIDVATFSKPVGITAGSRDLLYVSDWDSHRIRVIRLPR